MKNWKYINGAEVGNASTGDFTNLINRASKLMQSHPEKKARLEEIKSFVRHAFNLPGERWQYHIDRLNKELDEIEKSKVGNAIKDDEKAKKLWEEMQHAKKLAEDWAREINRTGDNSLKGSQKDAEEAYKKAKKAYDDYALNSKTGNSDGVARMFEGLVKDENKEVEKDSGSIKDLETENELTTSVEKGKLGQWNWYVHKNGAIVAGGTSKTESEANTKAQEAMKKEKVGNLKDSHGNELGRGDFIFVEVPGYGKVYVKIKQINGSTVTVTGKEIDDMDYTLPARSVAGALKWGNSAADEKFAYVMREFDEGKLKSSSGETVTNPEQAKAIAYSESKKTENGLARARKAIH